VFLESRLTVGRVGADATECGRAFQALVVVENVYF